MNIFKYQSADDIAVLCADDAGSMGLRPLIQGHLRTFSMQQEVIDGAFLQKNQIVLRNGNEKVICFTDEVRLRGRHNLLNVLAAVTLARRTRQLVPAGIRIRDSMNAYAAWQVFRDHHR